MSRTKNEFIIYLDVTSTSVTQTLTGIPRVVRNLSKEFDPSHTVLIEYDGLKNSYFEVVMPYLPSSTNANSKPQLAQRVFKYLGEIPIISMLMTWLLRQRIIFYTFRRIFGSQSTKKLKPIDPTNGVIFLPEVPLNKGHSNKISKLVAASEVKLALFVHDLLPLQYPEYFSKDLVWKFHNYTTMIDKASLIFVSNDELKKQVTEKFNAPSVQTIPLPTSFTPIESSDFDVLTFLMVGTLEPRKNYENALKAFQTFQVSHPGARLIIVGNRGWKFRPIVSLIESLQKQMIDIQWRSNIDDSELQCLYQSSSGLVYPSHFEGYGLPIVEALSQNCPVITSRRPVLENFEQYGGVILVDPESVSQIAGALERLSDREFNQNLRATIKRESIPASWKELAISLQDYLKQLDSV